MQFSFYQVVTTHILVFYMHIYNVLYTSSFSSMKKNEWIYRNFAYKIFEIKTFIVILYRFSNLYLNRPNF